MNLRIYIEKRFIDKIVTKQKEMTDARYNKVQDRLIIIYNIAFQIKTNHKDFENTI